MQKEDLISIFSLTIEFKRFNGCGVINKSPFFSCLQFNMHNAPVIKHDMCLSAVTSLRLKEIWWDVALQKMKEDFWELTIICKVWKRRYHLLWTKFKRKAHIQMRRDKAYGLQSATPASYHEAQLLIEKWEGEEAFLIKPV